LNVDGKPYNTDAEGYLEDIDAWTPEAARAMASHDDLILTAGHWEVINILREYYHEYGVAPSVRVLVRAVGERLSPDKAKNAYLYRLFPEGRSGRRVATRGCPSRPDASKNIA